MKKYKRVIVFVLFIYMTILMAGCKAQQTIHEEPAVSVTPSIDRKTKQIDGGPAQGGTLTLPVTEVDTLHPYRTKERYVNYISLFIYESLFNQSQENEVEPWLVESWGNKDYITWNFKLKEDVRFHHGISMTAYDVKYTMGILETSESPFYHTDLANNIQELNVLNSIEFEVSLKEPDPDFLNKLVFPILSQSIEDKEQNKISGTGPYRYESMDESMIRISKNEGWWHDVPPYLDEIIFKVYPENEILDAFQNNEVDIAYINNVDFSKFQYRTDINYQVYADNQGNFIYVNPNGLFGQSNRQKALFRYISFRLYDMNLGQVQYFDEYSESPIDAETFKKEMIASGLFWNEQKKAFTYGGKTLDKVSVVVPKQDMQKLHTGNFLVNILAEAGIQAEIKTVNSRDVKSVIRSGAYDLSPVTEELHPWETVNDTLQRMQEDLGYGRDNSYIFPLYRNQQAILYKNYIRGEKKANYWNPYQGFQSWYLPVFVERAETP